MIDYEDRSYKEIGRYRREGKKERERDIYIHTVCVMSSTLYSANYNSSNVLSEK